MMPLSLLWLLASSPCPLTGCDFDAQIIESSIDSLEGEFLYYSETYDFEFGWGDYIIVKLNNIGAECTEVEEFTLSLNGSASIVDDTVLITEPGTYKLTDNSTIYEIQFTISKQETAPTPFIVEDGAGAVNIYFDAGDAGLPYSYAVYSLNGARIDAAQGTSIQGDQIATLSSQQWANGYYMIVFEISGVRTPLRYLKF